MVLGAYPSATRRYKPFNSCYDDYILPEEFYTRMEAHDFHMNADQWQPMWVNENAYAGYASPFRAEEKPIHADGMCAKLSEKDGEWTLTISVPEAVAKASCTPVTTERLGAPVYTEEKYENPDGTPVDFTLDMVGARRDGNVIPGPFASLCAGEQTIVVWKA